MRYTESELRAMGRLRLDQLVDDLDAEMEEGGYVDSSNRETHEAALRVLAEQVCRDPESHRAHMDLNGECPWCGSTGRRDPSLEGLSDERAVKVVERR